MATDQKTSTLEHRARTAGSVIENELPAYRAISNLAIFSVVCGVLSIFSWAHPVFLSGRRSWRSSWVSWPIDRSGSIPTC